MFTTIEETMPLLTKKEYIALEIAKALIADKQTCILGMTQLIKQANKAAAQIVEENA